MMLGFGGAQPWFDEAEPGGQLESCAERLRTEDQRSVRYEKFFQLYGGSRLVGIRPWESPESQQLEPNIVVSDKLRLNVVKAAIDTIVSKVGKLRPRPTFLTNGGDWSLHLKAKKLQKFMDGAYHQSDIYDLGPDVFRDAMLFGTGVFHPYSEGKRLCAERVRPWELYVDAADGLYGKPRCLYRVKWVSLECAASVYELGLDDLKLDPNAHSSEDSGRSTGYVRCIEAWALPSDRSETREPRQRAGKRGPKPKPDAALYGRHVVLAGSKVVLDEDYPRHEFPFVFVHWTKPVQGFWGDSAVQEVVGLQVEINKLLRVVQTSMQRVGQPCIISRPDVILEPEELTNEIALHIKVKSDAVVSLDDVVKVLTFQPINPAITNHIWTLYGKAFEILGSNQLAASATAPVGLESGRALEALAEEHSERFMTVSRHFEHALGELVARQFLRLAKEIDAEYGGFALRAPGSKSSTVIDWSTVAMDEDAYLMQVFPTSVLPTTPAARIKEVERLAAAGWVDASEARRLLDFPDLRTGTDLAVADSDNLLRQLEVMLEDGNPVVPEPYQDLVKARRWATAAILRAQADGVHEEGVDLVRNYITACESLIARAAQAPVSVAPEAQAAAPSPAGAFSSAQQPAGGEPAAPPPLA